MIRSVDPAILARQLPISQISIPTFSANFTLLPTFDFDSLPSRPAKDVLRDIVSAYQDLQDLPSGINSITSEQMRSLYITHGWPEKFDAQSFHVGRVRLEARQKYVNGPDQDKIEYYTIVLAQLDERISSAQQKLSADHFTTSDERYGTELELRKAKSEYAWMSHMSYHETLRHQIPERNQREALFDELKTIGEDMRMLEASVDPVFEHPDARPEMSRYRSKRRELLRSKLDALKEAWQETRREVNAWCKENLDKWNASDPRICYVFDHNYRYKYEEEQEEQLQRRKRNENRGGKAQWEEYKGRLPLRREWVRELESWSREIPVEAVGTRSKIEQEIRSMRMAVEMLEGSLERVKGECGVVDGGENVVAVSHDEL